MLLSAMGLFANAEACSQSPPASPEMTMSLDKPAASFTGMENKAPQNTMQQQQIQTLNDYEFTRTVETTTKVVITAAIMPATATKTWSLAGNTVG